jgi:uncharacterized metal-binding protein
MFGEEIIDLAVSNEPVFFRRRELFALFLGLLVRLHTKPDAVYSDLKRFLLSFFPNPSGAI